MTRLTVHLTVNGEPAEVSVEPRTHLADLVRGELMLTGTHLGCEHGVCGACTVELDGAPARACLTHAGTCDGAAVRTIEGFADDEVMAALREAFSQEHALQCGYCTPGMLVTARDIVLRLPDADAERVREELSGNLCRCTGYRGIVRAVMRVLEARRTAQPDDDPMPDAVAPRDDRYALSLAMTGWATGPLPPASTLAIDPTDRIAGEPRLMAWMATTLVLFATVAATIFAALHP